MKQEIKHFGNKLAMKALEAKYAIAGAAVSAMAMNPMTAHAAGASQTGDAQGLVWTIADIIVMIFPWIGIFFILSGAIKMFLAYRNDQPEAQAAAAKDIVIGVVFVAFRVVFWPMIKAAI